MNTPTRLFFAGFLIVFLGAVSTVVHAGGTEPATAKLINNTITHLEAALKAVDANDLAVAQEHVKAAGQSSKLILGGSVESRKQGSVKAISNARQQLEKGNTVGATDALKEALEGFKSLLVPAKPGSQGEL